MRPNSQTEKGAGLISMKIVFYISSLSRGGAERVVLTLANHLSESCEIVVMTDTKDKNEYRQDISFQRINLNFQPYRGVVGQITGRIAYLLKLRKACRRCAPDMIVAFSESSGNRIALAAKGLSCKKVTAIRSNPGNTYKTEKERKRICRQLAQNDGIVFQTNEQKQFFNKEIQDKSVVILNPIGKQFTLPGQISARKKEVVTAGRLSKSKDHETLIRAYAILATKFPEYTFKIYGGGELKQELQMQIQNLRMEDRILLMGEVENVQEHIAKAAVFVLSSANEGLPNALMEAMAMGVPVVSTDCPCGGPGTLIRDGENGLLVPVGDEKRMAEAVERLLRDDRLAENLGCQARKIAEECSEEKISREWLAYLQSICADR